MGDMFGGASAWDSGGLGIRSEQLKTKRQNSSAPPIGKKAEASDADETLGKQVKQETTQELICRERHRAVYVAVRAVSPAECDVTIATHHLDAGTDLRTMTLTCEEFLRRFLQHVLPKGLPRIRYFGWLANRRRAKLLPLCRTLLHQQPAPTAEPDEPQVPHCPRCHGEMCIIERLSAAQIRNIIYRMEYAFDTS